MTEFTGLATLLRALYATHPIIMEAADEIERLQAALGKGTMHVARLMWLVENGERAFGTMWRDATAKDIEAAMRAVPSPGDRHE